MCATHPRWWGILRRQEVQILCKLLVNTTKTDRGWILGPRHHLRTQEGVGSLLDVEVIDQGDVVGVVIVEETTVQRAQLRWTAKETTKTQSNTVAHVCKRMENTSNDYQFTMGPQWKSLPFWASTLNHTRLYTWVIRMAVFNAKTALPRRHR